MANTLIITVKVQRIGTNQYASNSVLTFHIQTWENYVFQIPFSAYHKTKSIAGNYFFTTSVVLNGHTLTFHPPTRKLKSGYVNFKTRVSRKLTNHFECFELTTTTNNNNNLFYKFRYKLLVPQIATKLVEARQDEHENIMENKN